MRESKKTRDEIKQVKEGLAHIVDDIQKIK